MKAIGNKAVLSWLLGILWILTDLSHACSIEWLASQTSYTVTFLFHLEEVTSYSCRVWRRRKCLEILCWSDFVLFLFQFCVLASKHWIFKDVQEQRNIGTFTVNFGYKPSVYRRSFYASIFFVLDRHYV